MHAEVNENGDPVLDAKDGTEAVFVVCHQVAWLKGPDRDLDNRTVEGTSWQARVGFIN